MEGDAENGLRKENNQTAGSSGASLVRWSRTPGDSINDFYGRALAGLSIFGSIGADSLALWDELVECSRGLRATPRSPLPNHRTIACDDTSARSSEVFGDFRAVDMFHVTSREGGESGADWRFAVSTA